VSDDANVAQPGEQDRIAVWARDELLAAGLPVCPPGAASELTQGADVFVDGNWVIVSWNCHPRLQACAQRAYRFKQLDDPARHHNAAVQQVMLQAITGILVAAGFTVRDNDDDYAPRSVLVLSGPARGSVPSWEKREEELTLPGWHAASESSPDGSES
jgi:hypothetical protein